MAISNEKAVEKLVQEMGFNRTEVVMALRDTSGDVEKAVDKLLQGQYAPPPYSPSGAEGEQTFEHLPSYTENANQNARTVEYSSKEKEAEGQLYPNMKNFIITGLTNKGKKPDIDHDEDPTAPPLVVDLSSDTGSSFDVQYDTLPPPYKKFEKESKIKDWELNMNITYLKNNEMSDGSAGLFSGATANRSERCPVCFNAALSPTGGGEEIICHNGKVFHHTCFLKKHGPKCAHCCFPLAQPDKDHELSGKYLVYKNKDYHVECYEKFAGPRCCHCFNVIIEKPNGEFSGQYVIDKNREFHVECLQRKLYATWRAKNI